GETGAGKSIIVGALGFILGERGSSDLIRTGADKATVEGVFDISGNADVARFADEKGIDTEDGTLILKREISQAGRGRAWANGSPVTAGVLGELGRQLVNLHGQHEAQALLDPESQREILDRFGGAGEQAAEVRLAHGELASIAREITTLSARRADAEKRADYLRHVVREIEAAQPKPDEDSLLESEARVLENADELRSLAQSVADSLTAEDEGLLDRLASLSRSLSSMERVDPAARQFVELFDSGLYALDELSRGISDYANSVDLDPERLEVVRRRRETLYTLSKKYGPSLETVIETAKEARSELDLLDSAEFDIAVLQRRQESARARLVEGSSRLTSRRKTAARKLAKAVDQLLPQLGMDSGRFTVLLRGKDHPDANGAEDVEFRIALNVGHDARRLARVASGGELSRVMLALKTILARADKVPTLVFDEVDSGIGGKVGLQVGDTLRQVADNHQVFAISHLPQIAARAHNHIVVAKAARGGVTTADITVLTGSSRVAEIARMLGGDAESKVSREHARELLAAAGK
ncbi:MAG TPA: DNA repair protein RecN, partial [Gemmatimonadaceae bacterium]